jgi:hypothetical protein
MAANSSRDPWNKGKLVGQKMKEIWVIRVRLQLGRSSQGAGAIYS